MNSPAFFVLDTSYSVRPHQRASRARGTGNCRSRPTACGTSIIVACALRYGAAKKAAPRLTGKVDALLQQLAVMPLDATTDRHYATLRCELERRGQTIGANNKLIAAHALALDMTLITHNTGEFRGVPNLRVENWLAAGRGES